MGAFLCFCFKNSSWVPSGLVEPLDLPKDFEVVTHPQSPINPWSLYCLSACNYLCPRVSTRLCSAVRCSRLGPSGLRSHSQVHRCLWGLVNYLLSAGWAIQFGKEGCSQGEAVPTASPPLFFPGTHKEQ